MRPVRGLALFLASALMAMSASAGMARTMPDPAPGLSDFIDICVRTAGRRDAVMTVAGVRGYLVSGHPENMTVDTVMNSADTQRLIFFGAKDVVLDVEDGPRDTINLVSAQCSFGDQSLSQADLTRLATEWMGRPAPTRNTHGNLEWRFQLDGRRTPLPASEYMDLGPVNVAPIGLLSIFETRPGALPIISLTVFALP